MLNPDIRHLLTDALRPPTGFRLDAAIATTYSLAIESLLLAPLSMAAYEQGEGGLEGAAPHELLEAIRRYAERTTVFCQAGGIHVPTTYSKLTVFAEDSILEVAPPAGRVFHPKIWVLRYINAADDLTHRFVCMSRNLTGDRSWDTVLMTDEDSAATHQMPAAPLSAFLEDLLTMTVRSVSRARATLIRSVAESLRTRTLAVPSPFTAGSLHPLGTFASLEWPVPASADQSVVISPFLDATTVGRLPSGSTIVSRPETLNRLGRAVLDGHDLRVLQPHADAPPEAADGEEDTDFPARPLEVKTGLHAKVLAWDVDGTGTLLTGSANATSAAFGGNVEFGVLLSGPAASCGAAAILKDTDKETGFARLLQPFEASEDPVPDLEYALDKEIEEFHAALAACEPEFHVTGDVESGFALRLVLELKQHHVGKSWVRPITRNGSFDRPLGGATVWDGLGATDLTTFVAVRTRLKRDGVEVERVSALRATLVGGPDDRVRRILRDLLHRVEDVLRYLALLLRDPGIDDVASALWEASIDPDGTGDRRDREWLDDLVMLEPLVRAFARDDDSLDRVERLLDDLRDEEGRLPDLGPDFEALWRVVTGAQGGRMS